MKKFFIPDLVHDLRTYVKGCHICQLHRNEKPQPRQLQHRINPNYKAMTRLSIDLKVILRSYTGHRYILVVIDEATNFMITFPIHQPRPEGIRDALIEHVFSMSSIPEYMIIDQDSVFMSTLIKYLFMN